MRRTEPVFLRARASHDIHSAQELWSRPAGDQLAIFRGNTSTGDAHRVMGKYWIVLRQRDTSKKNRKDRETTCRVIEDPRSRNGHWWRYYHWCKIVLGFCLTNLLFLQIFYCNEKNKIYCDDETIISSNCLKLNNLIFIVIIV